ncbi:MAG: tetratricopeptide repeat protein [Verrucomicrobiaceae bacterium]
MSATTFRDLKDLGDRFYKAKKWEQAIKAYEEAESADPSASEENADFWFNRGFALIELKQWTEAKYAFEQCTAIAPENSAAWTNLGLCHRSLEEWQEGLEAYETATEIAPRLVNAWKGLAICADKLNNKAQRIGACQELVSLLPDDSYWRNELGRAHLSTGGTAGECRALAAFLESSRLDNDPCHPHNAALVYRKLNKWLDAADSYREALYRKPGYSSSATGLEEIRPRLQKLSAKVLDFAARLPPCKQPYERYLNPFEVLAINGRLLEMPDAAALRKLKQRVIQQIKLNDGHADWLEGAEIGESRVRQVLDDLDDDSGLKPRWHWVIYECPELNRLLSHADPRYFAFFADPLGPPPHGRPPYWQMRDKTCSDEAFFAFIHPPFLCSFEALLAQALELNDAELIQALSAGRLPVVDVFDYFRRANKWMEAKASEIKGYMEGLGTPEGISWWKQTPDPMAWFSVPLANALPNECKAGRTELGRALRALAIDLHNDHGLTDQALKVTNVASQLLVDDGLADQLKKDKTELEKIIKDRRQEEAEATRWNIIVKIRSDEVEVTREFIRYNDTKIATEKVTGIRFGVFKQYTNGIPTNTSYAIEACSAEKAVSIECKRVFRSETQAQQDFSAILNALSHQIFPTLIIGLAEKIATGKSTQQIGPLLLTKHGVQCETGSLWWKKQHTVPYEALSFSDYGGHVHVGASQPEAIKFSIDRRAVWNAVIVEKLVEIIKLMQSQAK